MNHTLPTQYSLYSAICGAVAIAIPRRNEPRGVSLKVLTSVKRHRTFRRLLITTVGIE